MIISTLAHLVLASQTRDLGRAIEDSTRNEAQIIETLKAKPVTPQEASSLLPRAAMMDKLRVMAALIAKGADPNWKDADGQTVLWFLESTDAVELLAKAKVNFRVLNKAGETPFFDLVERTLRREENALRDRFTGSALDHRTEAALFRSFYRHGMNLYQRNNKGMSIMDLQGEWKGETHESSKRIVQDLIAYAREE